MFTLLILNFCLVVQDESWQVLKRKRYPERDAMAPIEPNRQIPREGAPTVIKPVLIMHVKCFAFQLNDAGKFYHLIVLKKL